MFRSMVRLTLGLLTAAVVGLGATADAAFSVRLQNLSTGGDTGAVALTPGNLATISLPSAGAGGGSVFVNITLAALQPTNGLNVANVTFGRDESGPTNATPNNIRVTIFSDSVSYLDGAATMTNSRVSVTNSVFLTDRVTTTGNASAFPTALGTFDPPTTPKSAMVPLIPATTTFAATGGNSRFIQTVFEGTYAFNPDTEAGDVTVINGLVTTVSVITPVPATALAAFAALPVLGLGLRRRMKPVVA